MTLKSLTTLMNGDSKNSNDSEDSNDFNNSDDSNDSDHSDNSEDSYVFLKIFLNFRSMWGAMCTWYENNKENVWGANRERYLNHKRGAVFFLSTYRAINMEHF